MCMRGCWCKCLCVHVCMCACMHAYYLVGAFMHACLCSCTRNINSIHHVFQTLYLSLVRQSAVTHCFDVVGIGPSMTLMRSPNTPASGAEQRRQMRVNVPTSTRFQDHPSKLLSQPNSLFNVHRVNNTFNHVGTHSFVVGFFRRAEHFPVCLDVAHASQ
jgi:hypothetical protein